MLCSHSTLPHKHGGNLGMCEWEDTKKGMGYWGGNRFWPGETEQNHFWSILTIPTCLEYLVLGFNDDALPVAPVWLPKGSGCRWHLMTLEWLDGTLSVPVVLCLSIILVGMGLVEVLEHCISMGSNQFWVVQTSYRWFKRDESDSSWIK